MRRCAVLPALLAAAAVAGCGALDPFPTVARAPEPGQPGGARVAICYNPLTTAREEVSKEAGQECAAGTRAEPVGSDLYLQTCPVLLPTRATFVCTAKK